MIGMKKLMFVLPVLLYGLVAQAQQERNVDKRNHYVCIQETGVYHDQDHCALLQLCSGGKIRKTKDITNLKPCKKCARPVYVGSRFTDIKRILGVKDRVQIRDSLGTGESTIRRADGLTIRITGLPESKTVNMIEFYFDRPIEFSEGSLLSEPFYDRLGLQFKNCRADTIRNTTPHPVSGKVKKDFSIEYRGCAIIERRDQYEDITRYFYKLDFVTKEGALGTELEKVQLTLRVD